MQNANQRWFCQPPRATLVKLFLAYQKCFWGIKGILISEIETWWKFRYLRVVGRCNRKIQNPCYLRWVWTQSLCLASWKVRWQGGGKNILLRCWGEFGTLSPCLASCKGLTGASAGNQSRLMLLITGQCWSVLVGIGQYYSVLFIGQYWPLLLVSIGQHWSFYRGAEGQCSVKTGGTQPASC